MTFFFGQRSITVLSGVHRELVILSKAVISRSPIDIGIVQGARTPQYQAALFAQGREALDAVNHKRALVGLSPITAKENQKTVTKTLASKHLVHPDGFGHAIDFGVYINGIYINGDTDDEIEYYKTVADLYVSVASEMKIPIVAGALWSSPDWGHIELDGMVYR